MKKLLVVLFVLLTLGALAIPFFLQEYNKAVDKGYCEVKSQLTNLDEVEKLKSNFVIADGIAISKSDLENKKIYCDALSKTMQELEGISGEPYSDELGSSLNELIVQSDLSKEEKKNVLLNQSQILQLGAETKSLKNDEIMQSILHYLGNLKTGDELKLIIQVNNQINTHALNGGKPTSEWICRLTRSTIWLCAIRASQIHGERGAEVLKAAEAGLAPLNEKDHQDFANLESAQKRL